MWISVMLAGCLCGARLAAATIEKAAEKQAKRGNERLATLPLAVRIRYRLLIDEERRLQTAGMAAQVCRQYRIAMSFYNAAQHACDRAQRLLNATTQ